MTYTKAITNQQQQKRLSLVCGKTSLTGELVAINQTSHQFVIEQVHNYSEIQRNQPRTF